MIRKLITSLQMLMSCFQITKNSPFVWPLYMSIWCFTGCGACNDSLAVLFSKC